MEYMVNVNLSDISLDFNSESDDELISNLSFNNTNKTGGSGIDGTIPLYMYIVTSVINILIFIIGTFGNILVIVAVTTVRDMRTPTNLFLLNLSVSDILVLLICQPAGLLEFYGKDRWFLGELMCKYKLVDISSVTLWCLLGVSKTSGYDVERIGNHWIPSSALSEISPKAQTTVF
ncbi:neuromedin U receptor [Mactra antiquata]